MSLRQMKVARKRELTPEICEFALEANDGAKLTPFAPGANITVETPSGAMRCFSLVNDGYSPNQYVIAVKNEPTSRGGSSSMHKDLEEGSVLNVAAPENSFTLGDASSYLLIAGGIGITPIYAMAQSLTKDGKPFKIIYCSRSAGDAAYLDELKAAFGSNLIAHHDNGDPDNMYDFWDHFAEIKNIHVYCCGPKPLMKEIKAISGHWPEGRVNFEDFKPVEISRPDDAAFEVRLQKSAMTITVPKNQTILEAVRAAGVPTTSSCEGGACGACKSSLIEGDVDHRDVVLMEEEKSTNIMICVSRAKSGGLVIDL
ncbi:MAG: oxidoreductase [Rhizobiales bacterium]|nr:oxidoreductase [Hyphomicrobiales bacterium]